MAKILVVDDDQTLASALSHQLRCAGFEVLTAYSAETAAELAVRERPDLILLDIDMPHYTGLELHQCLKCSTRARDIPVLFLSGNDGITQRAAAVEQGAIGCVVKKCNPKRLLEIINGVLAGENTPAAKRARKASLVAAS